MDEADSSLISYTGLLTLGYDNVATDQPDMICWPPLRVWRQSTTGGYSSPRLPLGLWVVTTPSMYARYVMLAYDWLRLIP